MDLANGKNAARQMTVDGEQVIEIALTQGKVALIDPEDWDRVRHLRWYAAKTSGWYAHACPPGGNSRSLKLKLHNVVLGCQWVDHADENGLNNRRGNLRPCTNPQNQQNTGGRGGSSPYKGVSWDRRKSKWRVAFNWNRKTYFVGNFASQEEAAVAYDKAILELAGPFARLNFPVQN